MYFTILPDAQFGLTASFEKNPGFSRFLPFQIKVLKVPSGSFVNENDCDYPTGKICILVINANIPTL